MKCIIYEIFSEKSRANCLNNDIYIIQLTETNFRQINVIPSLNYSLQVY